MLSLLQNLPGLNILSDGKVKYHIENEERFQEELKVIHELLVEIAYTYAFNSFIHFDLLRQSSQNNDINQQNLKLDGIESMNELC